MLFRSQMRVTGAATMDEVLARMLLAPLEITAAADLPDAPPPRAAGGADDAVSTWRS